MIETEGTEIAWIPSEFAMVGKRIILGKKKNGQKAIVKKVFAKTNRNMATYQENYKKMKKRTDI